MRVRQRSPRKRSNPPSDVEQRHHLDVIRRPAGGRTAFHAATVKNYSGSETQCWAGRRYRSTPLRCPPRASMRWPSGPPVPRVGELSALGSHTAHCVAVPHAADAVEPGRGPRRRDRWPLSTGPATPVSAQSRSPAGGILSCHAQPPHPTVPADYASCPLLHRRPSTASCGGHRSTTYKGPSPCPPGRRAAYDRLARVVVCSRPVVVAKL